MTNCVTAAIFSRSVFASFTSSCACAVISGVIVSASRIIRRHHSANAAQSGNVEMARIGFASYALSGSCGAAGMFWNCHVYDDP